VPDTTAKRLEGGKELDGMIRSAQQSRNCSSVDTVIVEIIFVGEAGG